jgi:hypothetical protein
MDIILGILLEDESIILAHNSAHLVPLLPGTHPNVFSSLEHQTTQARDRLANTQAAAYNAAQVEVHLLRAQQQAQQQQAAAMAAAQQPDAAAAAAAGAALPAAAPAADAPGVDGAAAAPAAEAAQNGAGGAAAMEVDGAGAAPAAAPEAAGGAPADAAAAGAAAPAQAAEQQQQQQAAVPDGPAAMEVDQPAAGGAAAAPAAAGAPPQPPAQPGLEDLSLSLCARAILDAVPPERRPAQLHAVPPGTTLELARHHCTQAWQLLQGHQAVGGIMSQEVPGCACVKHSAAACTIHGAMSGCRELPV